MATSYSASGILHIRGHGYISSQDTHVGLLQAENVVFYLDMTADDIPPTGGSRDTIDNNGHFWEGGVFANTPNNTVYIHSIATKDEFTYGISLDPAIHDYGNNLGVNRITCCLWAYGLLPDNGDYVRVGPNVGGINTHIVHLDSNGLIRLTIDDGVNIGWNGVITTDLDWAFYVIDFEYSDEKWTLRHSMNGSGWITEPAISGQPFADLIGTDWMSVFIRNNGPNGHSNPGAVRADELIYWRDATLFTSQELQDLYDISYGNNSQPGMNDYITESPNCDLFIEGTSIISSSGTLFMYGWSPEDLIYATSDLYIGGLPSSSADLFINGYATFQASGDLYVQGLISIDNNSPLYLGAYSLLSVSGDLFIEGLINIQSSGNLFIQGPLLDVGEIDLFVNSHKTNDNNTTLYTRGLTQISGQTDLFVNGFETINDGISLYLNGHLSINDNTTLYEEGHEIVQGSQELVIFAPPPDIIDSMTLFLEGPTSVDEGRAMDWFLKTSDYYPQIIGTFDSSISGVTIQVWDVVNAQNTSVPLTSSGCYQITDTGRWGWSTSNLPSLSGYQHQYYYLMTGDPNGTFDGQFFLEVPEDAKWTFPSSQDEYIM